MTINKIVILQDIRDTNQRLDEEIEYFTERLEKTEFRMSMIQEEHRQLVELLEILKKERNNGSS